MKLSGGLTLKCNSRLMTYVLNGLNKVFIYHFVVSYFSDDHDCGA